MKFCKNCGKELIDEAAFCPGCGTPVGNTAAPGGTPADAGGDFSQAGAPGNQSGFLLPRRLRIKPIRAVIIRAARRTAPRGHITRVNPYNGGPNYPKGGPGNNKTLIIIIIAIAAVILIRWCDICLYKAVA